MSKYRIFIQRRAGVFDPELSSISDSIKTLNFDGVKSISNARIFDIKLEERFSENSEEYIHNICRSLLVNDIIEDYNIEKIS